MNDHGVRIDDHHLLSPSSGYHRFTIWVSTEHPSSPDVWLANIGEGAIELSQKEFMPWRNPHRMWWNYFWKRSWIDITQTRATFSMPQNEHPVLIGEDQGGQNQFQGEFGRTDIWPLKATDEQLKGLAKEQNANKAPFNILPLLHQVQRLNLHHAVDKLRDPSEIAVAHPHVDIQAERQFAARAIQPYLPWTKSWCALLADGPLLDRCRFLSRLKIDGLRGGQKQECGDPHGFRCTSYAENRFNPAAQ